MKTNLPLLFGSGLLALAAGQAQEIDRCQVLPLPGHQVSLQVDGIEAVRWHCGVEYPRPFFFPFNGPSGTSLTRMGHPGAPDHDHHRSVWLAHHDVNGLDFWSDGAKTQIRQKGWYAYRDGRAEAVMAAKLGWYDPAGNEVMEQDLIAALLPLPEGERALETQIVLRPAAAEKRVKLGKTNFGFLAVRVAKTLSVHFGGGQLRDSEGREGERNIFGQPARWVDYSGPTPVGTGTERGMGVEGITYFDHPANPRYPTRWHVREDGWMGAAFCLEEEYVVTQGQPLTLRYLLLAHRGPGNPTKAETVQAAFAARPGFVVRKSTRPHHQFEVERIGDAPRK